MLLSYLASDITKPLDQPTFFDTPRCPGGQCSPYLKTSGGDAMIRHFTYCPILDCFVIYVNCDPRSRNGLALRQLRDYLSLSAGVVPRRTPRREHGAVHVHPPATYP